MTNTYSKYYADQAGSGIDLYSHYSHQKGDGYFGRFYARSIKPLLTSFIPVIKETALHGASKAVKHLANEVKTVKRKSKTKSRRAPRRKKRESDYF